MLLPDFLNLLKDIDPKQSRCPLECLGEIFPHYVFELIKLFLGGLLNSALPVKSSLPHSFSDLTTIWLKRNDPSISQALPQLLRRRFCHVQTSFGTTKFESYGFYDSLTNTVICIDAPFVLSEHFEFVLTFSPSSDYSIGKILTHPQEYHSSLLYLLLRVIYPDLQAWLAQNLSKSEYREQKDDSYLSIFEEVFQIDFPDFPDFFDSILQKSVRVGKFRRRKKYSMLKKKKRKKIERTARGPKKRNRPHKARVHRKNSRATFL